MSRPKARAAGAEQERIRPAMVTRVMTLELDAPVTRANGEEDPRIPIAISSESPVERYDWWTGERYLEVLDHGPGAIDLSYAKGGMPFLMDHNARAQIGLIEDVRLDSDRKLRGLVRMGNHPDATWVEKDIRAGIRTKISVGYDPGERYEVVGEKDSKIPTRKYRGWVPMEGSSVAVPADLAVGVDRSAAPAAPVSSQPAAGRKPEERNMAEEPTPAPQPGAGPSAAEQREKDTMKLAEYAEKFPEARDLLGSWLKRGVKPEQALEEVQTKIREAAKPAATPPGHVDLSANEQRRYSITSAIQAAIGARSGVSEPWKHAGLEREVSDAVSKRTGKQTSGFFLPMNIGIDLSAAARYSKMLQERASVTGNIAGTSSLGGAGVQTTIVGFIDLLRTRTQVVNLGATMLTGLTDTIAFNRQLTANTFNWAGENPSTANALTAATLEVFTMAPSVGMSSTAYSKQLLVQGSFDVNAWVMNDLTRVNAIGVDSAALFGTGSGQPKGIRSQTGVTLQTVGANGAAADWPALVLAETNVANANADIGTMGWLVSPKVRGKWKTTLKSTTAGSLYLWGENNTVNGYRAEVSTQIPDNITQGTGTTICSTPIFGVWSELMIGEWGGALDVVVDPYSFAQQNMVQIVTSLMIDVNVRQPKAFNIMLGVTTT